MMKKNHWYHVPTQSLAVYTRKAGFDLALYEQYDENVRLELRRCALDEAWRAIWWYCHDKYDLDLGDVVNGVYVISLTNPLSIKYQNGRSRVIYIGRGNILDRIRAHFDKKLFDFMLGLSGADFEFHFA